MVTMALAGVVLAREQHLGLELLQQFARKTCSSRSISAFDVFAFARQFEQRVQVGGDRAHALVVGDGFLQALALLHHLLAFFGLRPEVGRADLFFEFVQLGFLRGSVKDSSARRLPVRGGAGILVPILLRSFQSNCSK